MSDSADDHAKRHPDDRWRDLMRAAQDGDEKAYSELLSELLPLLRRVVGKRLRGRQDVEDIVQEILLSLHSVRHTYDPDRPFVPWVMAICSHRISDAARNWHRRAMHESTVDVPPETFSDAETKSEQDNSDDREEIQRALAQLTPGQREAIEFLKLEGLSLKEASSVSGKSIANLKVTLHRGLKAMRRLLERKS